MSVEISGPKGYDYQYLITLLIALEYLDKEDVEVYIEKENEEDAQISFHENGIKYSIDIQVKRRSDEIDIINFVDWICHFESRSVDLNLLNKIERDENRFVLIVSNSRCSDDVSLFVDEGTIHCELSKSMNNNLLNKIRTNICSCYSDKKALSGLRRKSLKAYLDGINNNCLRNIVKRIKVRDRYTEEYATEKIKSLLNRKYYIPQSMVERAIIELIDKIRIGREMNGTISIELIKVIDKYSGKNIFNMDNKYVRRDERELCRRILSSENILLLTGISFCGKTYLAKDIAQEYLNNGYKIEITGEIYSENGALAFLKQGSIEDRLLILEDPFGQVETKKEAIGILNEVRTLIREAKENRRIIITSRKDILLDIMSEKCVSRCSINSLEWIDLTLKESNTILIAWEKYFGTSEEAKKLFGKINNWLLKNEKICSMQLGHVANIFNSKNDLNKLLTLEPSEIVNISRIDSNDLAKIIEKRGDIAVKVFIALGLSCNTYKSVNINDLAFILSDCSNNPSIHEENDYNVEYSFGKRGREKFPEYNQSIKINDEFKRELKHLNKHGYIEIDNLKRIIFVHPIYHYATQILFKRCFLDIFEKDNAITIAKQSLSSLSINANLCTLSILGKIYLKNADEGLKSLILRSLNSIFPSVRDRVIMFFDRRINNLNELEQKEFVKVLRYGDSINNNGILWYNGIPWINPSKEREFSYRDWLNDKISKAKIDGLKKAFDNKIILSSEEMWNLLSVRDDKEIPFKVLERALSYDETFIREKAIKLIFKYYAFTFSKLDKYLDVHEHPNVIYGLFRGALDSWLKYNNESQKLILEYYKNSLNIMSVAIRSKKFLENFEDEYSCESIDWSKVEEDDKKILWDVWHEAFVEFLKKFPSRYIKMNEPRMARVVEYSLKYINSEEKVVSLASAWFNWLNMYLQYNTPQDFGMSVAQYLMDGTLNNSKSRENIFKLMLSTNKTSFVTSNVKVFIDSWKYLSDNEKLMILDLLTSNRVDVKWIKAVSLNRKNIPIEIQIKLLGELIDGKEISRVVDILIENDLLEQCLNVHCGHPQPLWWNGYHHNNYKLWDSVIVEVLKRNVLNKTFDIALREVIDLLYNNNCRRIINIYDLYTKNLLNIKEKRKCVFERLLFETINQNQCNRKVWNLLFEFSDESERENYYEKIAKNIELIQIQQINDGDLLAIFNKEIIFEKIYPRIKNDYKILVFCNNKKLSGMYILAENNKELMNKFKNTLEEQIIEFYNKETPRMSLTNRIVECTIKKYQIESNEIYKLIEDTRVKLIDEAHKIRETFDDEECNIENWIY